jgi:hypothetical protein
VQFNSLVSHSNSLLRYHQKKLVLFSENGKSWSINKVMIIWFDKMIFNEIDGIESKCRYASKITKQKYFKLIMRLL